jgi:CubicO group peptidase (beta-lactamase class C family)
MNALYRTAAACFVLILAVSKSGAEDKKASSTKDADRVERFEKQVEELRRFLKIPGMSAVIVKDQKILWSKGFGFADTEKQLAATPETLYHVASLTKTFAATLVMQLVEQGKLDLDEPVSRYSTDFKDDSVRVKHLLSHTSEDTPGERYSYNGNRYDYLTAVIEKKCDKPFRELIVKTFLEPLEMSGSVPGHDIVDEAAKGTSGIGKEDLDRYQRNLQKLARPYTLYGDGEVVRAPYPPKGISAAAGLLSTVLDMARYDAAIDRHTFLKQDTQDRAWTRFVSNSGQSLPHGLGWFVQDYQGVKLIWHFGHWGTGFSATYLKVPKRNLSLILLANSEALSDPFYSTGGIETNAFACSFLRLFVLEGLRGRTLPDPSWSRNPREFADEHARLNEQAGRKGYECERLAHAAMVKWIDHRRVRARVPIKLNAGIYDAYVGKYELNPNRQFTVSREGDRLFVDIPKTDKSELFPESEANFFLKVRDVQVAFVKDKEGKVTHLEIVSDAQTIRARKIK